MKEKFIGKSLLIEDEKSKKKILVISDLHLGYEEGLNEQGIFIPRGMYKDILKELEEIFSVVSRVDYIVVLGDLRHEFSGIWKSEWKEVIGLIDYLKKKVKDEKNIVLIKGNHDNMLWGVVKNKGLRVVESWIYENYLFIHGDIKVEEMEDKKIKSIVVGHMHPAITIKDKSGVKQERYKCFLVGDYKKKKLVILPSFFPLIEGSDINFYDTNLGWEINLKNFEVFVVSDNLEVLEFGRIRDIEK